MKKLLLTAAFGVCAMLGFAQVTDTLKGHITTNTTLLASKQYLILGYVYVDSLKTLTIPAGTVLRGDKATLGTLIISRGAKIRALGTQALPVVFTSNQPAGSRAPGDWGGLVIAGTAKSNLGTNSLLEGGTSGAASTNPPGYEVWFGGPGTTTADNASSGKLAFVRIEFGGVALFPNKEINGLTMAGVGAGTIIHHVQVSHNGDDAFEWFGGKVNTRYIIAYKNTDDDFDADNGYNGANQWGLSVRDANVADVSKSNGFEIDNDATGSANLPKTKPVFTNFTIVGPKKLSTDVISANYGSAAHLRRNCEPKIFNSLFIGYPTGILIDGSTTGANANGNLLKLKNSVISTCDVSYAETGGSALTGGPAAFWLSKKDSVYATVADLKMRFPHAAVPDARLKCASNLVIGSDTIDGTLVATSHVDHSLQYRGAFDCAYDWTIQWTEFNAQNFNYCTGCNTRIRKDENATEVNEAENIVKATVYPNPTNDGLVTITFELENDDLENTVNGVAQVHIYDVAGREVLRGDKFEVIAGFNQVNVDATSLPKGVYMVKLEAGKTIRTSKMIISNN